jgi:hypothetical protein
VTDTKRFISLDLPAYIRANNVRLIVLSPLQAFLKSVKELNSELEGRRALEKIRDGLQGTDCALLALAHLNKKPDLAAVERVLGSVVYTNFVRSVLMAVVENKETEMVRLNAC